MVKIIDMKIQETSELYHYYINVRTLSKVTQYMNKLPLCITLIFLIFLIFSNL